MEVVEVIRLADWFVQNTVEVEPSYAALVNVLQNNAGQPTQQPVKEPLIALSELLGKMPTQELSALQMQVLETLFVSDIVGNRGKHWLNKQVRSTVYDPATTFQTIQQAAQRLTEAKRKLVEFKSAALAIGIKSQRDLDAHSPYLINVIFQGDAAINNVSDWKKTATDWEMIISGVAGIVGEKPEEVKVVGTSNGSIIFVLSASAIFTKVLATISKHISAIANDY